MLTVYGIETGQNAYPLIFRQPVATVLTVYGIETPFALIALAIEPAIKVATVLTVYGIETRISLCREYIWIICVATVLTVYGIETQNHS